MLFVFDAAVLPRRRVLNCFSANPRDRVVNPVFKPIAKPGMMSIKRSATNIRLLPSWCALFGVLE